MPTPLLATKLYIPAPRPNVVLRAQLIERLNQGLHRKLTLLSAQAGFGKTTLISAWLAECPRPVAWLSLDDGDSSLPRFLSYLIAALQTIMPTVGAGVLAALEAAQLPPTDVLVTALLNDIVAQPVYGILVLDDYHLIDARPVDDALALLLEHLPPQLHLVVATREDPPLPLARLRVRDQLTELRAADLRFTATEAASFLNQAMALNLAADHIAALETRTEGWVAGLQLAALSLHGRADVAGFVRTFAGDNHYIVDYLVDEVLSRQPEHVRTFLLQTAMLERLSGPLCDAVTGQNDSRLLLDALERGNLFVVPLDDQRQWFRYHHLFADLLASHAQQSLDLSLLHRRASAWYAANGWPADAIRHALAANDPQRAAGLIEQAWPVMDGRFQADTWMGWAQALPEYIRENRPVLSVAYAWGLLNSGELEAAAPHLRTAEWWLEQSAATIERPPEMIIVDEQQFRTLPASIATARTYLAQASGDVAGSVVYGRRALELLPADDHLRRGPAAALLGLAHWASGDLELAYQALATAMANFQKVGNLHFAVSGTYGLADIRTVQGRLHEAIAIYTQALQLALAQGEPLLRGTADLYLGLSELYLEQGQLADATQNLLRSMELGQQAALPDWPYRCCRVQSRFKAIEGDFGGALALLEEAARHYTRTPVPDVRPLAAMQMRVWLAQGRLHEARRWASAQGLSVDDELSYIREFEHITLARVLLAESSATGGDSYSVLRLLDRLLRAAEAGGRIGSAIEIGVLQSLAQQTHGNHPAALAALERAMRLAEPQGYIRIFVDHGPIMEQLLASAAAQGILPSYTRMLLAAFANGAASGSAARPIPAQPLIEPLSAREIEVLQLMALGLSNSQMSERLFLALSTVKGHNRSIFEKLQVQRRTEAVARARELGLL